jgi:hypothetical protein
MYGPILLAQRNGTKDVPAFKWAHQGQSGLFYPIGTMPFLKVSPKSWPAHPEE